MALALALALALAALLLASIRSADALSMTVYRTECVQEHVEYANDIVTGNFVVVDHEIFWASDHPGIDFVATSPAGVIVSSIRGSAGDKFSFTAAMPGLYKFCFHNTAPSPETVDFYIHVGHILNEHNLAKDEHLNPVHVKISQLKEALESLMADQHYLRSRVERHHNTNRSTQKRLLFYTIGEYLALAAASVTQVLVLKHLFNRKIGYTKL
ncbi:hypothetical protein SELMODRAFT_126578 [Selaginella moellendorffii]|uniref:GOLD domain-containing protein n=2 Tax=Selaginella moellendorffii TaxID=88036 RepID=D8SWG0_SELML|nr:hypothetical protein SELMODRAFT_126578 [Selaginella moellendorffii]